MTSEKKYLIKKEGFKGQAETMVYNESSGVWLVEYSGYLYNNKGPDLTLEEYSKLKNEEYDVVTYEEMEVKYVTPYLQSLQGPFVECTQDDYMNALECLPPKRWTRSPGSPEFFFLGECFTFNLYSCYLSWKDKYYTALRDINTPKKNLFDDLTKLLNK